MVPEPNNFNEFWSYYLGEHRSRRCRSLHYVGSAAALTTIFLALASGHYWWLIASTLAGYAPAWFGHFFFEKNRPATFKYPLFSLLADGKMFWRAVSGQLTEDFKKFGVVTTR